MYVSYCTYGQDKPFEGALTYRYTNNYYEGRTIKWETAKLYFKGKMVIYDSIRNNNDYYRYLLDPLENTLYVLPYKYNGKKGFKLNLREYFRHQDSLLEKYKPDTAIFNPGKIKMTITPVFGTKKLANLEVRELGVQQVYDKDTVVAEIYLNTSLNIKLSDYECFIKGYLKMTHASDEINNFTDGLLVKVLIKDGMENSSKALELFKIEQTNKYSHMFDLSHCIMEKGNGFFEPVIDDK